MLKKIVSALLAVAVIFVCVVLVGNYLITSSPVYDVAKSHLQQQFGASAADLHLKRFGAASFTEDALDGKAEFVLCDKRDCFGVKADKRSGDWKIVAAAKK